jgi:hypothetical protein
MLGRIVLAISAPLLQGSFPPLVGEGLKPSATHIIIVYSQNVFQAGHEPGPTMNVQLQYEILSFMIE